MKEEHFIQLPSQSNVYSVSKLGSHLIVGTGDYGKVFAQISKKDVREVPLQNLPHECDIIAVDAYVDTFPVLAVAFAQKANGANISGTIPVGKGKHVTAHLHIYSTWISSSDQNSPTSTTSTGSNKSLPRMNFQPKEEFHSSQFEFIGQNHVAFKLDYFPFHLYHVPVVKSNGNFGNVLLLSGSDHKIHVYESDDESSTFVEVPVSTYFPELAQKFPDIVTRIRIEPVNEITRRITLCGLQNGTLQVWIVTCKPQSKMQGSMTESTASTATSKSRTSPQPEVEADVNFNTQNNVIEDIPDDNDEGDKLSDEIKKLDLGADGDSTSLTESIDTTLSSNDEIYEKIEHTYDGLITSIQSYLDGFDLNVIVSSALSPTYVYANSYEERFKSGTPLKFSSRWDTVQACCVADIDHDGRAEIILGTFGQALMVYKYMDEILPQWVIVSKKQFSRGILAIEFINQYLHVVTALGIHVLEYNTSAYFTNKPAVMSESFELGR